MTWRASHFGIRQELTARITAFDRPRHFRDSQVMGAFRHFDHDHWFETDGEGRTLMREVFTFSAPWGPLGWLAERCVLRAYLRRFLGRRAEIVRAVAEGEEWRKFLRETSSRSGT
ncbi:MAG TPA: hypothetical protein VG712_03615 [Gemmatimonadales bacterium]|nr:hypothetical protein [Gemmatimonadales bacterium]